MAVNFAHNAGISQTVLGLDPGSVLSVPFPFTLATFFNPASVSPADPALIAYVANSPTTVSSVGGEGFYLNIDNAGNVRANCKDFVFNDSSEKGTFSTSTWSHAAAVFDGVGNVPSTKILAYLDGVAGTPLIGSTQSPDNVRYFYIGGRGAAVTGSTGLVGCLAHAACWRIELSAAQIALLSSGIRPDDHATLGTTGADLVWYLELLDEASAETATAGSNFTLYDDPPNGVITTCADSPDFPAPVETGQEPGECGIEDEADQLSAAIAWPQCVLVPEQITVNVVAPTVSPGRSFTDHEKLVQPDPGYIQILFSEIPVRTRSEALQWREIETLLKGRTGAILVPIYEAKLSATPITATIGQAADIGATSIVIEQAAGADIRAGMYFSIGERAYLIQRINITENGISEVVITPSLRAAVADNDVCEFNEPICRCRLASDDAMNIDLGLLRFARPSVAFVEDV